MRAPPCECFHQRQRGARGTALACTCYTMSMSLDHRLQILIDDERHRRISAAAQERGVSVATIVREAIDRGLANPDTKRLSAARRLLDAPDMDVPDPQQLHAELDQLRARHT
jgi:predicted DNA-binding protein